MKNIGAQITEYLSKHPKIDQQDTLRRLGRRHRRPHATSNGQRHRRRHQPGPNIQRLIDAGPLSSSSPIFPRSAPRLNGSPASPSPPPKPASSTTPSFLNIRFLSSRTSTSENTFKSPSSMYSRSSIRSSPPRQATPSSTSPQLPGRSRRCRHILVLGRPPSHHARTQHPRRRRVEPRRSQPMQSGSGARPRPRRRTAPPPARDSRSLPVHMPVRRPHFEGQPSSCPSNAKEPNPPPKKGRRLFSIRLCAESCSSAWQIFAFEIRNQAPESPPAPRPRAPADSPWSTPSRSSLAGRSETCCDSQS